MQFLISPKWAMKKWLKQKLSLVSKKISSEDFFENHQYSFITLLFFYPYSCLVLANKIFWQSPARGFAKYLLH